RRTGQADGDVGPEVNEDTLVVVHCYEGDQDQVIHALPQYLHHGCPVLVLSPTDAPVILDDDRVICMSAGKRAYDGQISVARQYEHLRIVQALGYRYHLLHDSDSVCLSPDLPA